MRTPDINLKTANRIRRRLVGIVDGCEIYPRKNTHLDSVSLAMFARMAELHKGICLLTQKRRRRDGAILARTLCEAVITYNWLTNSPTEDRADRYVKYWGKVRQINMDRIPKYFGYNYKPTDPGEINLINEAKALFRQNQWYEKNIAAMAQEHIEGETNPDGTRANLSAQYELYYFWLCLTSHPTVMAIECFWPTPEQPFSSSMRPQPYGSIPESYLLFLSTIWLFQITMLVNKTLKLRKDIELEAIFKELKR